MLCIQDAKTKPTLRGLYTEHCVFRLSLLPFSQCHYQKNTFSPSSSISSCGKKRCWYFSFGGTLRSSAEKPNERHRLLGEVSCHVWKAAWDCWCKRWFLCCCKTWTWTCSIWYFVILNLGAQFIVTSTKALKAYVEAWFNIEFAAWPLCLWPFQTKWALEFQRTSF